MSTKVHYKEIPETAPEFNSVAATYDDGLEKLLGCFGKNNEKYAEYKIALLRSILPDTIENILDFGCGTGRSLQYIKKYFAKKTDIRLFGCDVSDEELEVAKKVLPEAEFFLDTEIKQLAIRQENYDLVLLACVLHHISPEERESWFKAIFDKIQPGGFLAVFEHNLKNPYVRKVVRDPRNWLDHEEWMVTSDELVHLLKKACPAAEIYWKGYTLFSPFRYQGLVNLEKIIKWFPLGGQHCVVMQK